MRGVDRRSLATYQGEFGAGVVPRAGDLMFMGVPFPSNIAVFTCMGAHFALFSVFGELGKRSFACMGVQFFYLSLCFS